MLFEELIGIYASSTTHRSKERDRYSILRLTPHFQGRSMSNLRRVDVRAYVEKRKADGVKISTVTRELKLLSAAINFVRLELDRHDIPNPVERLGLERPEGRLRWLSREEAAALVSAAKLHARRPHLPAFIRLALHTGCRKSELLGLQWRRVDFDRAMLRLDAEHTKAGRRRYVPLNDAALSALREMRAWCDDSLPGTEWVFATAGGRMTTLQVGFVAACARAGIEDFKIHDLRHTCASWLVMAGTPLQVVKELLGHSSITVTERYAHLAPGAVQGAVQRLLPFA